MVTRTDIEAALAKYRDTPHHELPEQYRQPTNIDDLVISIAIFHADKPGVAPVYDEHDVCTGWSGIRVKKVG